MKRRPSRIFLLSPANASGDRGALLLRPAAQFPLARRVRSGEGAPLGEVFEFTSGLYFRGKRAYARTFARPPRGMGGAWVITPGRGLLPLEHPVGVADLRSFAEVPIDLREPRYRVPLEEDARALAKALPRSSEVVLLGSVASDKYTGVLLEVFGERLQFPAAFVGRGDMSRGGLMLRCVAAGLELEYVPVKGAVVHGARPPRLPPMPRALR